MSRAVGILRNARLAEIPDSSNKIKELSSIWKMSFRKEKALSKLENACFIVT
jgi:hypothetical protein